MRTLFRATLDVQASNQAIIDGMLPKIIKNTTERLHPEATYFLTQDGCRTCIMVFDMKDPSDIPAISEIFFMNLNAKVEFTPVMNADDLQKGMQKWEKNAQFIPKKLEQAHAN